MAFTVPSVGTKTSDQQSVVNEVDTNVIQAGVSGLDCVLSGCAVTGSGTTSVAVAKGAVLTNGVMYAIAANGTFGTWTADATNPRIDLVVINSSGTLTRRAGTAAASPVMPALTANDVLLASVWIPANESPIAIVSADITDKRMFRDVGAITVAKKTSATATNSTTSAITAWTNTIPNAIGATVGKILRCRIGGNILCNSGTPTIRVAILWGSTAMYSAISASAGTDPDRKAWMLDFDILFQGTSDQALVGTMSCTQVAAATSPTTGIGPGWGTGEAVWPLAGAGTADFSGTSDQTLNIEFTFNVNNANVELVVEYATLELV